jgi:23S rRNA (uracil1939-C5)-methyltransferase
LQHLSDDAYASFKRDHLAMHLSYAGIKTEIVPTIMAPPHSRRRAVFAAHRANGGVAIGFHGRRSHRIVPISDCAVIRPALLRRCFPELQASPPSPRRLAMLLRLPRPKR